MMAVQDGVIVKDCVRRNLQQIQPYLYGKSLEHFRMEWKFSA